MTDLVVGNVYGFKVCAVNSIGKGEMSVVTTTTVEPDVPSRPAPPELSSFK